MAHSLKLKQKLINLPAQPGVYMMKDKAGFVLYVGKAKSLRQRVRFYFQESADLPVKTHFLVSKTIDFDYIITDTEKEALILESNLIKKNKPRYNVTLKDDKHYPYLKLTVTEEYPRLFIVRKVEKDGALYFGPFSSANAVRETLQIIHKIFPIRTCSQQTFRRRSRPCINFQLKRCLAPCCYEVEKKKYDQIIKKVLLFLRSQDQKLLSRLTSEMEEASKSLDFERAGLIRNQIRAIQKTLERQKIISSRFIDRDIIGYFREGDFLEAFMLFIRRGRMIGNQAFSFREVKLEDDEVVQSFIGQYYSSPRFIPDEIIMPFKLDNQAAVEEWLSEKKGKKMKIVAPQRGERKNLLRMAFENAEMAYKNINSQEETRRYALSGIYHRFHLQNEPRSIECFDISNLSGDEAVGSMVRFENGLPVKQKYRRYKIKTVDQPDDYGMMYEVVKRRLNQGINDQDLPDLIVVDGGKGQLHVAGKAMAETGLKNIDLIALAKSRLQESKRTPEKIFLAGHKDPIILIKDQAVLHLLQRIRDESHRFAIAYHRKLRQKKQTESILDKIAGIGPIKKKSLLKQFGSVKKIKNAGYEELATAPSISRTDAKNIIDFFGGERKTVTEKRFKEEKTS